MVTRTEVGLTFLLARVVSVTLSRFCKGDFWQSARRRITTLRFILFSPKQRSPCLHNVNLKITWNNFIISPEFVCYFVQACSKTSCSVCECWLFFGTRPTISRRIAEWYGSVPRYKKSTTFIVKSVFSKCSTWIVGKEPYLYSTRTIIIKCQYVEDVSEKIKQPECVQD